MRLLRIVSCLAVAVSGIAQAAPGQETGLASVYSDKFQGRPTASGDIFDQKRLTAAHRELPLGSEVTVTNLETGRSVQVEINDRGPFIDGRVIDLSEAAAKKLGIDGLAPVRIESRPEQLAQTPDGK